MSLTTLALWMGLGDLCRILWHDYTLALHPAWITRSCKRCGDEHTWNLTSKGWRHAA